MTKVTITLFLLLTSLTTWSQEEVYTVIIRKQEVKKQSRWSLADWLATKRRISLMDQWLALNTESNIFEFVLDYSKFTFDEETSTTEKEYNSDVGKLKMYVTFLGLELEGDQNKSEIETRKLNLSARILGSSAQTTHINLLFGKKWFNTRTYGDHAPLFYGIDGDLYILNFLGLSGSFEKNKKKTTSDYELSAEQSRYGAFLELWFLRFYYEKRFDHFYFKDTAGQSNRVKRDGDAFGIAIYL